ncbi:MAG: FAD-dependent monooxygenase [Azoarcus sp.]|nr:FAD-dependent monooxygenase [Azoarcus sp.]
MQRHDLLIVGAGPVGLALALFLKDAGLDIILADTRTRNAAAEDPRILALSHGTRLSLEQLGVWKSLPATPIKTIHISQQGSFGRAVLQADDYEIPALGHVIPAGALADALRRKVDAAGIPVLDGTEVSHLAPGADDVIASLSGEHAGTRSVRLAACAEGGVSADTGDMLEHDYHQHALISQVSVSGGHRNTAFERFTSAGPAALLPCAQGFAVVHVVAADTADSLLELDDSTYLSRLQAIFGHRVSLTAVTDRLRYPLLLRYRKTPVGQRTVWLGNAAQTMHPVAGQGFNLALRDVHAFSEQLIEHDGDPGDATLLGDYGDTRSLDRLGTIRFTDSLVRLFSNDIAPLRHARGAGLFALDLCAPLRHFVAKRMMFGARAWP